MMTNLSRRERTIIAAGLARGMKVGELVDFYKSAGAAMSGHAIPAMTAPLPLWPTRTALLPRRQSPPVLRQG